MTRLQTIKLCPSAHDIQIEVYNTCFASRHLRAIVTAFVAG